MRKYPQIVLGALVILAFGGGWFGHLLYSYKSGDVYASLTKTIHETSVKYNFTNPFLLTDNSEVVFHDLDPLQNALSAVRDQAIKSNDAEDVSLYFRDLTTGRWTGVNEDATYEPASLQKVTLLLAYLHAAENDSTLMTKRLLYEGDTDKNEYYQSTHDLIKGHYYSVNDLLVDSITKSGNDSTNVLLDNIAVADVGAVYKDLELPFPMKGERELQSPKEFASTFRVLYNSTYLDPSLSEKVLGLLTQTDFNKGLVSGVPSDVLISHKFGERTNTSVSGTEHELHDCGIVYYPGHPYLLCVMTKGSEFPNLEKVIGKISSTTYNYWKSQF